jgi:Arc/MetJ family transcription regulator
MDIDTVILIVIFSQMKMTVDIPDEIVRELMNINSLDTKREAIEFALRDTVRRLRMKEEFKVGLGLSAEQLMADAAPKPSDALDAPDLDNEAIERYFSQMRRHFLAGVNERETREG